MRRGRELLDSVKKKNLKKKKEEKFYVRRVELKLRGWMGGSPAASGTRCEGEEGVQTHPDKRLLNASWSKTWLK